MQGLNLAYVRYYNLKYKRHGPVFQDRFESRILDSDEYNLTVSAYIHNNPKDIAGFSGKEWQYPYSSYGIYLGIRKDLLGLVDMNLIMDLFNLVDKKKFIKKYGEFVSFQRDIGSGGNKKINLDSAVVNEYRCGREIILREHLPGKVITFISGKLFRKSYGLLLKSKKGEMEYRAICAYALRVLCGMGYREICKNINNMTVSGCSRLCNKGYKLISGNTKYESILNELAECVT